ncbi:MAG: hypothetical protein Q8M92_04740, partial [Candidatus Subteraquimicrobiales bacterium]|nr:hypothetical protein [Candidatus Subteraquimicrobiales bacterium]
IMEEITKETYGLMLFQEQSMQLAVKAANFTQVESEVLRKIIGKSKGKEAIDEYEDKFIAGCISNKIPKKTATNLWKIMRESGHYQFNKSHAVAYSAISYWCAWLKAYHPKEFLVALMEFEVDDIQGNATRELREMGYQVRSPDINKSKESVYIAVDGEIYMGLSDVEGVGEKAVEEILKNQPYSSFDDFMGRVQKRRANSRVVKNLIQSGAFDSFGEREDFFYSLVDEERCEWGEEEKIRRQMMVLDIPSEIPLIDYYENPYKQHINITPIKDIEFTERIDEIFVKGIILDFSIKKSANTKMQEFFNDLNEMGYFYVDDGTKKVECFIAPEQLGIYEDLIIDGSPALIKGHTYGKKDKIYVDALINLDSPEKVDETLKKYLVDMRVVETELLADSELNVDVINYVTYHTSRNGKNYARIIFSGGETGLCFNLTRDVLKSGEIICWKTNKKPFVNIVKRIS